MGSEQKWWFLDLGLLFLGEKRSGRNGETEIKWEKNDGFWGISGFLMLLVLTIITDLILCNFWCSVKFGLWVLLLQRENNKKREANGECAVGQEKTRENLNNRISYRSKVQDALDNLVCMSRFVSFLFLFYSNYLNYLYNFKFCSNLLK